MPGYCARSGERAVAGTPRAGRLCSASWAEGGDDSARPMLVEVVGERVLLGRRRDARVPAGSLFARSIASMQSSIDV